MMKLLLSFISIVLLFLTYVYSFPCPSECICKPTDTNDEDFTRMSYLIDCANISLYNDKLIYQVEEWSINADKTVDDNDEDDDSKDNYVISIDLSKSLSLKKFTNKTIQLTGFSFSLRSLSLTDQSKNFALNLNSFNSNLYQQLEVLNLSSCCKQVPKDCQEIFRPLKKLQILDLSGTDMYEACLNSPDTISTDLRDLILRNNIYGATTFSHTSRIFDGVRMIPGKLDLQNSRFQMKEQVAGNCLFDLFQQITTLDLSNVQFGDAANNTELYLKHFLKCKTHSGETRYGENLLNLYLRQLNLESLPEWFTPDRFPLLKLLDLSYNNFQSIDINAFSTLDHISLAYNPIELRNIAWRADKIYKSINLRSTTLHKKIDISLRLKILFKLTKNIDYSENEGETQRNLTTVPIGVDFNTNQFSLNISRTNLSSFQVDYDDLRRLDISSNALFELNLYEQRKLNYLDCSNQILDRLIFSEDLLELTELKCSNNSLTTLGNFSLLKNEKLKSIDLSYNYIKSLKDVLLNINSPYLRTVNFKSNLIEIIPSNIFHKKLISLYEINLSWNNIHTIRKDAFQSPNLQILDLSKNPIKSIAPNPVLITSLRVLLIFNNTQISPNRCQQLKTNYKILSKKFNISMKNNQTKLNKCLTSSIGQTKTKMMIIKGKRILTSYTIYLIVSVCLVGLLFGGIYYFRKSIPFRFPWRHYKKLDRNILVENEAEMDQREDDEIVMNLEEPPFNKFNRISSKV